MSRSLRFFRFVALATAVAFLALTVAQQSPPPAQAVFEDSDGDGAIDLAEEAAGSDPNDPRSIPETTGTEIVAGYAACSDGADNDLDGLTDEDDPGCTDSDGDLVADPGELLYGSDPNDSASFPEDSRLDAILDYYGLPVFFCADTVDNDLDGLTDADDPGCTPVANDGDGFDDATEKRYGSDPGDPDSVPEHEGPNPGSCSDGLDNDLDGLIDEADPACGTPDNDDRADALAIAALPFTDGPRIMKNATTERDEPRPSCTYGPVSGTVWYRYTATEDTVLIADTAGSDFDVNLSVWRETGLGLEEVACDGIFRFPPGSRAVFQATAGETYLFQVDGFPYGTPLPRLTFNLEVGIPPANDNFDDATVIATLPFSDTVDTSAATTEFGEPRTRCTGIVDSTVWYAFTPTEDALLVADTAGSEFETVLAVWTESTFGLAEVACHVGFSYDVVPYARLALQVNADQTYFFQVSRYPYSSDLENFDLTFNLEVGIPPANDDLADATAITSLPFGETVDTLTATTEAGEPTPSCITYEQADSTVWYSFTPEADTFLVADTAGGEFYGTFIGVYQGSSLSDLTPVACGSPWWPATQLAFQAAAGQTYLFQVGGLSYGPVFFGDGQSQDADGTADGPITGEGGRPEASGYYAVSGSLVFNLDVLDVPPCPAPQFSVDDPVGDTFAFGPFGPIVPEGPQHDIVSVSGGSDAETFCLTVELAGPIDPPDAGTDQALRATVDFDIDGNRETGYHSSLDFDCRAPAGLGVETQLYMSGGSGILVPIYQFFVPPEPVPVPLPPVAEGFPVPPPEEQPFAIALFNETSFTIVVPLGAIGGDDSFHFAMLVRGASYEPDDCVPNGGFIRSPTLPTSGDVNCDDRVDSVDATMIMQLFARLIRGLPCQHVGDVNGNGGIGPLDALLILQFDAGLLDALPPVPNDALEAAVQATVDLLEVSKGAIQLGKKEAMDWGDSCLGLPEPEEACLTVITPGYRITLKTDTHGVVWRTNEDGSILRLERMDVLPIP